MKKKVGNSTVPQVHKDQSYDLTPEGRPTPKECLNPMRAKLRPCTHKKVNEQDH